MRNTGRRIDPLPVRFASEDEAAKFWDTHSLADHEEVLVPADIQVNIKRRHFEKEPESA